MFDRDRWIEIFEVLSKNKLRTGLTGLGVFWGVLMLILMLGAGNGLRTGSNKAFGDFATNSVTMWTQRTTMPYKGMPEGRMLEFTNEDMDAIRKVPGVALVCPNCQLGGYGGGNNVTRGTRSGGFSVYGQLPEVLQIQTKNILNGRWMNDRDLDEGRKICVIGNRVAEVLFAGEEDPIGEFVSIQGVNFMVVGVFSPAATSDWSADQAEHIVIPLTTFQRAFSIGNTVGWYSALAAPGLSMMQVRPKIEAMLKSRKKVHPDDTRAFGGFSAEEHVDRINMVFTGINGLVWIVGILTLIAGVIGVSNIMLVIVKERTKEIGIRRALGATPWSIIVQILMESVFLTGLAGYTGLAVAMVLLGQFGPMIEAPMFANPSVDLNIAMYAIYTLVFFGLLAGLIPAYRAIKISPVDALRSE